MYYVDCVVIGAGVIGLSIARALAKAGRQVFILEASNSIGTGISSRNSEVIHAGLYYPSGSLKSQFCVSGNKDLYRYCDEHNIPVNRCGKLIVATNKEQWSTLDNIRQFSQSSGVTDLKWLTKEEVKILEPEVHCCHALFSPSTGVIDSHSFMLSLLSDAKTNGAELVLKSPVISGEIKSDEKIIITIGGKEEYQICCNKVINSSGLNSHSIITTIKNFPREFVPNIYFAKGNYFTLNNNNNNPFKHLIYPIPEPGGLGIHVTIDINNKVRFGPDVEWVDQIQYDMAENRADHFYSAISTYWPRIPPNSLVPAYCGIRPKLSYKSKNVDDFLIQGPETHGIKGLVNLFGIESPGLTSSLQIGEYVKNIIYS